MDQAGVHAGARSGLLLATAVIAAWTSTALAQDGEQPAPIERQAIELVRELAMGEGRPPVMRPAAREAAREFRRSYEEAEWSTRLDHAEALLPSAQAVEESPEPPMRSSEERLEALRELAETYLREREAADPEADPLLQRAMLARSLAQALACPGCQPTPPGGEGGGGGGTTPVPLPLPRPFPPRPQTELGATTVSAAPSAEECVRVDMAAGAARVALMAALQDVSVRRCPPDQLLLRAQAAVVHAIAEGRDVTLPDVGQRREFGEAVCAELERQCGDAERCGCEWSRSPPGPDASFTVEL